MSSHDEESTTWDPNSAATALKPRDGKASRTLPDKARIFSLSSFSHITRAPDYSSPPPRLLTLDEYDAQHRLL
ncbi:hypothetical protein PIIN_01552 [Serendipita indica DSM 11827]|uniref:Uncharacterized protein n=1 Tax=Serendipita indica (strain DSM 11827) TaxID=1109443 RepID=G4T8Q9_SERID|nr:hypothetical protein PIIN_01552 [Serendipita indica DSM 11827]